MQTECLVQGNKHTAIRVNVRFLHLLDRTVGELDCPQFNVDLEQAAFHPVDRLEVGDRLLLPWQEAVEREQPVGETEIGELIAKPRRIDFNFPASRRLEPVRNAAGDIAAVLVREQQRLAGQIELSAAPVVDGLFKIRIRIENRIDLDHVDERSRDDALMHALISTHTILGVASGEFVSLIDPPDQWRTAVADCKNIGTWPVLVGMAGDRDTLLSSPIILYDYPEVAPESPGDLFDSLEIDEILTLRIQTLTDDEKHVAAALDERVRALLNRTESLGNDRMASLHGTFRGLHAVEGVQP
jgi:hydrogenase maturation protease